MFGFVLISAITLMHIYVFWRAASVPLLKRHLSRKLLIGAGLVLWTIFFLGRVYGHNGIGPLAKALELLGMNWMAALFLLFVSLLAMDFVTGFGFLVPRLAPSLRGTALVAGLMLSVVALVQGMRPPVVQNYTVYLRGLAAEMDGTVLVAMSDLHLGNLLGKRWLEARVAQVQAQIPDLVVLLGDLFEGHGKPQSDLLPVFRRLSAPLGVWAVTGNHEFHHRYNGSTLLAEEAGFQLLRNRWAEVRPGLVMVGVDDLTSIRRSGQSGDPMSKALAGRPPGASILLSHTPWQAEKAAKAGVGLMLSGHTHGGQIWPFDYLVQRAYPLLEGRYEVDGMTVIVCRGTGTWGPRMRLWRPSEILQLELRAARKQDTSN
ncbi:MAG: metallophosphoesterase [Deltaproteobacteria bacterium]|nr:metallophosphoesterase [Deltaproteobacteria bacterium]